MAEYILRSARVPDSVSFSRRQRTMLSVANSNSVRSSVMLCAISCIDGWSEPSVHEKSPSAMAAVDSAAKGPITANICTSVRLRARIGLSPLRVQWSRAAVTAMRRRPTTGLAIASEKHELRAFCASATCSIRAMARAAMAQSRSTWTCFWAARALIATRLAA